MEFSTFLLLICTCVVKLVTTSHNVADIACGRVQVPLPRIVGGEDALPGEFPWLVSIRTSGVSGAHYCGGSIINKRYILTAAHCIYASRNNPKYIRIVAGAHNIRPKHPENGQMLEVTNIILHSNYSKRYINDIALMQLKDDLVWNKFVRPICLPDQTVDGKNNVLEGQYVTVAGWGDVNGEMISPPKVLQKVIVEVLSTATCENWYTEALNTPVPFYDSHLCAGYEFGGKDSCKADSGGPLMTKDKTGKEVAIGIVSAGIGCGQPKKPGIYTRISRYINWIESNIVNSV